MSACPSLDHLVRAQQQRWRDGEAERLGSRRVDDQLERSRLSDRKVSGVRAFQDAVHISRGFASDVTQLCPVDHQKSWVYGNVGDRRQAMLHCKVENFLPVAPKMRVAPDEQRLVLLRVHLFEEFLQIIARFELEESNANAEFRCGSCGSVTVQFVSWRRERSAAQHGDPSQ